MRCAPRPVLPRRNMETERERDTAPRFPSPHLAFRAQCKPAHPAISRASRDAHSARVSALAEPPPQSSSAKRSSLRTGPSADRAETAWPARRRFFLFWGTRAVMVVDVIDAARSALCGGRRGGPSGRCGVVAAAGAAPGERGAHGPCMYHACWPGEGVAAAGSAPAMAMRAGGLINVARASSRPKSATACSTSRGTLDSAWWPACLAARAAAGDGVESRAREGLLHAATDAASPAAAAVGVAAGDAAGRFDALGRGVSLHARDCRDADGRGESGGRRTSSSGGGAGAETALEATGSWSALGWGPVGSAAGGPAPARSWEMCEGTLVNSKALAASGSRVFAPSPPAASKREAVWELAA
mmetsp:Transcript_41998/g.135488  ORF Transcript_41998/g.135488 Transcript_41998/m.135488 type:complete len:357 (+) Transcript_41998:159-1229(+)